MKIVALIMAGGKGERFWPASTESKPKQFLCLGNDNETMIQKTVNRFSSIIAPEDFYILTNQAYIDLVKEQLPGVPNENIVCEPVSRNTAPAIQLGLENVKRKYEDALVVVLPSDHLIANLDEYLRIMKLGLDFASTHDSIITIGIKPTEPNVGYGYIELGKNEDEVYRVNAFREKPNLETAKTYLKAGNYVWNAGMFIFTLKTMDKALKRFLPKQYEILASDTSRFAEVESISIDYGVMEKADNIYCIPGDFGWDDVGSWLALERVFLLDEQGNCILNKEVSMLDTKGTTIKGTNKKLIATLGVENLIIVETDDAILIASKDHINDIKKLKK